MSDAGHTLSVRGRTGSLKVGYQQAATLGDYTLTTLGAGTYRVEASVVETNACWLSQGPLTLEIEVGPQRWSWREVSVELDGGRVSCTVSGRPDRR